MAYWWLEDPSMLCLHLDQFPEVPDLNLCWSRASVKHKWIKGVYRLSSFSLAHCYSTLQPKRGRG